MTELDFEKSFKLWVNATKLIQCHPESKGNICWVLRNIVVYIPYTLCVLIIFNNMLIQLKLADYFNAFRHGVPVTFYITFVLYYCLLVKHRHTIGSLMKSMTNDYETARHMENTRQMIILEHVAKGKTIMNIWRNLMIGGMIIFVLKSMVLTMYHTRQQETLTLVPFHEMDYPLNIEKYKSNNVLVFIPTFMLELYFTSYSALIYFCAIPPGPIFVLHACGQLELIKMKFDKIFERENVNEELKTIVQDLRYVYSFVDSINQCFTFMYEVLLKSNMLVLPFTSYAMLQSLSRGQLTIEYASLFMEALFCTSIPCYYGDLLLQKGEEVRLAAYNCGWERVNSPKSRLTLLIIMTRAQHDVAIQTIFSRICLDTLTNVYRQAYTIFNLMTAVS